MSKQVFEDYSFSVNVQRRPDPSRNGGNQVIMTVTADEDTLAGLGSLARSIGGGWGSLANAMAVMAMQPGFMDTISGFVSPKPKAEADPHRPPRRAVRRGHLKVPRTNEEARRYVSPPAAAPKPAATAAPPPAVRPELPKVKPLKKK